MKFHREHSVFTNTSNVYNRICQEQKFQEYEHKDADAKIKNLERKLQTVYNEAKVEINSNNIMIDLSEKCDLLKLEHQNEIKKQNELQELLNQKSRDFQKLHVLLLIGIT